MSAAFAIPSGLPTARNRSSASVSNATAREVTSALCLDAEALHRPGQPPRIAHHPIEGHRLRRMGRCFRTGSSLAGRTRKDEPRVGFGDLIALRPRECQELLREGRRPDVVALLHGEIARAAQRAHLRFRRRVGAGGECLLQPHAPLLALGTHVPVPIERPSQARKGFGITARCEPAERGAQIALLHRELAQASRLTGQLDKRRHGDSEREIPLACHSRIASSSPLAAICSRPNSRAVSNMR